MTTTSRLAQSVLHMPAMPVRVQLVRRLSDSLRAAMADAAFTPADVAALDASLHQVLNGWNLSVSRFLRVQDEVEAVLARAMVGRPLRERVLGDLEDVFLALWNQPGALSVTGLDRLDS
jgi:hypothetical protein